MTETILDERAVSEIEDASEKLRSAEDTYSADRSEWYGRYLARAHFDEVVTFANVSALCATVKHLRAENDEYERRWRNQTQRNHTLSQANRELQSQLEQLRAENERCRRALRKFVNWYAADSTEEKRDSAFDAAQEALADERLYTEVEFKAAYPDRAFTWDLDEHPEDGSGDICACRPCRELSYED